MLLGIVEGPYFVFSSNYNFEYLVYSATLGFMDNNNTDQSSG